MYPIRNKLTWLGLQREYILFEYQRGLLYRRGKFERLLEAGAYRFWRWEAINLVPVDIRQTSQVISGQEMLTADHIDIRLTVVAQFVISDPVLAWHVVDNYLQQLYQDIQLALREAVTARELDAILGTRDEIGRELMTQVAPLAATYGIMLNRLGIKDIILPKNVHDVMMKEVEAQREGRASLIRAQHGTAAARARANTAKILADNPQIVRLQELETLVALASKPGSTIILPNLANLLNRE
jgi:regulator of protease activity HflC (stomatin/prohibitin superfamily)